MTYVEGVTLIGSVVWPLTVLVLALAYRRRIGDFLAAMAGRITRLQVMSFSLDFAVAKDASPHWRSQVDGADVRGLVSAQHVTDSYFDTLRQSLLSPEGADFFVVDLKSEGRQEWLTSRLYLFTYLLSRLKRVRAVVFVGTSAGTGNVFLGLAHVDDLLRVLAHQEPRLRLARLHVEADQVGRLAPFLPLPPLADADIPRDVDEWWDDVRGGSVFIDPLYLAQRFLTMLQSAPTGPAEPPPGWLRLPSPPGTPETWECATWISATDLTDGFLEPAIRPDESVADDLQWSDAERLRAIAATPGDFVALLRASGRFDRLVDRRALLEALGRTYAESGPKP